MKSFTYMTTHDNIVHTNLKIKSDISQYSLFTTQGQDGKSVIKIVSSSTSHKKSPWFNNNFYDC